MTMTMITIITTTTTRMSRNFISCTSSWSSKRCRQWTSCSLKSFFEFWTTRAFSTTFEKNQRSFRTWSLTSQFQSTISRNQFTSWDKKRFAWYAESTTNERIFFFEFILRFEMFFKLDLSWSMKRNSLFHVVQIEFVHDRESKHHNKKARQQRVFFFELWKHVSYNFIIAFIVDNFVETFVESFVKSLFNSFSINKKTLNIWHVRLKHLKEQTCDDLLRCQTTWI